MAEKEPQTFANHTRFDPWFHFFVLPVFGLLFILTVVHFVAHVTEGGFQDQFHAVLLILLAAALLIAVFKIRLYALKVQDRVIRLEERMRLASLLPEPLRGRIPELTVGQLVALRFASDAELPRLAERALSEKLSPKDIKKAIQIWRPDDWRV
jgi:cellulose synthase/poly-beta-1,6-N-acetylglucosamine synthase-like glycosyltransferase